MKNLRKTLCALIYASAFIFIGVYTNQSLSEDRARQAIADIAIAKYEAKKAKSENEAAQFNAINTYWSLEAKRTDVERAVKRAVFAEGRLQKACVRMKGRC